MLEDRALSSWRWCVLLRSLTRRIVLTVTGCSLCIGLNSWGICCDKLNKARPACRELEKNKTIQCSVMTFILIIFMLCWPHSVSMYDTGVRTACPGSGEESSKHSPHKHLGAAELRSDGQGAKLLDRGTPFSCSFCDSVSSCAWGAVQSQALNAAGKRGRAGIFHCLLIEASFRPPSLFANYWQIMLSVIKHNYVMIISPVLRVSTTR